MNRETLVRLWWRTMIWALVLTPMAIALAKPRGFDAPHLLDLFGSYSDATKLQLTQWIYRGAHVVVAALSAAGLLLGRHTQEAPDRASGMLWIGCMALCGSLALASVFGTNPAFVPGLVTWPLVLTALWRAPRVEVEWYLGLLGLAARSIVLACVAAVLVAPSWAVESGYSQSLVPGFDLRLHGVYGHANTLGPLLVIGLLAELHGRPSRWRWPAVVLLGAALLLTQSKTNIAAAALVVPWSLLLRTDRLLGQRLSAGLRFACAGWSATVLSLLLLLGFSGLGDRRDARTEQLATLTGRTVIWDATLEHWRQNPWCGYGPTIWDDDMQEEYLPIVGWRVAHAHNQYIHSLGHSGLIGLLCWIGFILCLGWTLVRHGGDRVGEGLAWLSVVLICTFSEPWFDRALVSLPWLVLIVGFAFLVLRNQGYGRPPSAMTSS